jgi:hypothetical protein
MPGRNPASQQSGTELGRSSGRPCVPISTKRQKSTAGFTENNKIWSQTLAPEEKHFKVQSEN